MKAWLAHSLKRYYPASKAEKRLSLSLEAARGERISFQALCRTGAENPNGTDIAAALICPKALKPRLRRIGYVPVPHLNTEMPLDELEGPGHVPGLVPDPLFDENSVKAGPEETHGFWISLEVPKNFKPGLTRIVVSLNGLKLSVQLKVHRAVIQPRKNFPVTHWFYADAFLDFYKLKPFEPAFWKILRPYVDNMVSHGQDVLYVPLLTPPLDGVKRPTQLLKVRKTGKRYRFDWSDVARFVKLGKAAGITHFEWVHFFTQWGVERALRVYQGQGEGEKLLWPAGTKACSPTYRHFLSQALPELKTFLEKHGILESSYFHISDEPRGHHVENYKAARQMMRELAPWMRVMDALSHLDLARQNLVDLPIPSTDVAAEFHKEGIPIWVYHCVAQRYRFLNRFMDTPLTKIRMHGWILYKTGALGFLHWGYNYWHKTQTRQMIDPFTVSDGLGWPNWTYGDCFVVYPGANGPIDSLRWECFAESMQDYALLQSAKLAAGHPLLSEVEDYEHFPRSEAWILRRRHEILNLLDRKVGI